MLLWLTTMRYFLSRKEQESVEESKKSFCTRRFKKKKMFSDIWQQTHWEGSSRQIIWSMEACEDYKMIEKFDKVCS